MNRTTMMATLSVLALVCFSAAPAYAAIGELKVLMDTTYTLDSSFDVVSGDDYLFGGGLELGFDLPLGFGLGLEYTYAEKQDTLFLDFPTGLAMHSPRLVARWRYKVTDWFAPYVRLALGIDAQRLRLENGERVLLDDWSVALPAIGGHGGFMFLLPSRLFENVGAWKDCTLGVFIEVGYLYRRPVAYSYTPETSGADDSAGRVGRSLGELDTSGPSLRGGVVWQF